MSLTANEAKVLKAALSLAGPTLDNGILLRPLRKKLGGMSRASQDEALGTLQRKGHIVLYREDSPDRSDTSDVAWYAAGGDIRRDVVYVERSAPAAFQSSKPQTTRRRSSTTRASSPAVRKGSHWKVPNGSIYKVSKANQGRYELTLVDVGAAHQSADIDVRAGGKMQVESRWFERRDVQQVAAPKKRKTPVAKSPKNALRRISAEEISIAEKYNKYRRWLEENVPDLAERNRLLQDFKMATARKAARKAKATQKKKATQKAAVRRAASGKSTPKKKPAAKETTKKVAKKTTKKAAKKTTKKTTKKAAKKTTKKAAKKTTAKKTTKKAAKKTAKKTTAKKTTAKKTTAKKTTAKKTTAKKTTAKKTTAKKTTAKKTSRKKAPAKARGKAGEREVTFDELWEGTEDVKSWVCAGPRRSGCGGGKRGGHVVKGAIGARPI